MRTQTRVGLRALACAAFAPSHALRALAAVSVRLRAPKKANPAWKRLRRTVHATHANRGGIPRGDPNTTLYLAMASFKIKTNPNGLHYVRAYEASRTPKDKCIGAITDKG